MYPTGTVTWSVCVRTSQSFCAETRSTSKTGRSKPSPLYSTGKRIFRYVLSFMAHFHCRRRTRARALISALYKMRSRDPSLSLCDVNKFCIVHTVRQSESGSILESVFINSRDPLRSCRIKIVLLAKWETPRIY